MKKQLMVVSEKNENYDVAIDEKGRPIANSSKIILMIMRNPRLKL